MDTAGASSGWVSGTRISLREICDMVRKISGRDLPVYVCREGTANEYTASNERFRKECPDFVYTAPEVAIERLYRWYEQKEEQIDLYRLLY